MNPELRTRSLMVGLLLIAWAVLVYLKTRLNPSVLPDLNAIIAQVQVLMGGVVGYHVGAGSPASATLVQTSAPGPQGGFASIRLLVMIAGLAFGLSTLAGCAGLNAQGVLTITYNTPAVSTSATLLPGMPASAAK